MIPPTQQPPFSETASPLLAKTLPQAQKARGQRHQPQIIAPRSTTFFDCSNRFLHDYSPKLTSPLSLMKSLFITLLILAGAFLAYDAFLAPPHERIVFEKGPAPVAAKPAASQAPVATPPTSTVQDKPKPTPAPTPSTVTATGFVAPAIATLEEATKNWTAIPARAFPRSVVLKEPVSIKMAAGKGQLAAGTSAIALAASQGVLTIAPSEISTARGQIPVTSTDFPDQIRSAYEAWKTHRVQIAKESWEARQKAGPGSTVATADMLDPAGKPITNSSGHYPLLLESMRSGQVTEVQPSNIRSWGTARPGPVDGQPGWLIEIDFTATTMFGKFDTQAQAQIRSGKVVRWIYTGSQEEVP